MEDLKTPPDLRPPLAVVIALHVSAPAMLYLGVMLLVDAMTTSGQSWSPGLFMVALGPAYYLIIDGIGAEGRLKGRRTQALVRLLRRVRPVHATLLVVAIAACLYEASRGVEPWWRSIVAVVACTAMLMLFGIEARTRSRSARQP